MARHHRALSAVVLAGATLVLPATLTADPPLQATLDGTTLQVSNVEAGGRVVLAYVKRWRPEYYPRTARHDEILVADGDGTAAVELDELPPPKFIAFAVELDSGRFDVVTPEGSPAHAVSMPVNSLQTGPGSHLDRLHLDGPQIELLLVRPGVGAWRLTQFDGGLDDLSPSSDGQILTELASMEPIDESGPPPVEYERDDILIQVAPRSMEYFVARIVR